MVPTERIKFCIVSYVCNLIFSILQCYIWQEEFESTMSKRQKKKAPVVEERPEGEAVTKIEYIYGDTQCVSGIELKYKWGEIYRLISRREVPEMGLEEEPIYANIEKSAIMKVATRPELFPCSEVIGWILPHANTSSMIIGNVEGHDMWRWPITCQNLKYFYLMLGWITSEWT